MTPALVIFRDRVAYARPCVAALQTAGFDVHIVDHGSTWPPALDWLEECGLPVYRRGTRHPRDLWTWPQLPSLTGDGRYLVTDPDVLPDAPSDWPTRLHLALDRHPDAVKAGLGLRVDDLPARYEHAEQVRRWEAQHWAWPCGDGLYRAAVDTTLALYRPLSEHSGFALGPALRTGSPYLARHLPWYQDSTCPTDETAWYLHNLPVGVSHWADPASYPPH